MRSPAALVVDDDAMIRETLRQILEDEGYAVAQAPDGVAALEILRSTPARLVVLLDVMMPQLDGCGVLRAVADDLRLMSQHRYVIMTANTLNDAMTHMMQQVGAPLLSKPFSVEALLDLTAEAASQLTD